MKSTALCTAAGGCVHLGLSAHDVHCLGAFRRLCETRAAQLLFPCGTAVLGCHHREELVARWRRKNSRHAHRLRRRRRCHAFCGLALDLVRRRRNSP